MTKNNIKVIYVNHFDSFIDCFFTFDNIKYKQRYIITDKTQRDKIEKEAIDNVKYSFLLINSVGEDRYKRILTEEDPLIVRKLLPKKNSKINYKLVISY